MKILNLIFGEKILMPYLLDRKIAVLDYVIISHFDTDHVEGILYLMKNMKIKNVIISKQPEISGNFEIFLKLIKEKRINLEIVEKDDQINIEKDLYFYVLWPDSKNFLKENSLNNNSLVCKLVYRNFNMLFTGDIEEVAENKILDTYKNNLDILKSRVLKIAHHGSSSSSSIKFLNIVNPEFGLIGVGENNLYNHPNPLIIKRLKELNIDIYRTDINGEITLITNGKKYKIDKFKK